MNGLNYKADFLEDLELILNSHEEYFIKYNKDLNELVTNIVGDSDIVTYFDASDKEDINRFMICLFKFMCKYIDKK